MSDPLRDSIERDLEHDLDVETTAKLVALGVRLANERPRPNPVFRGSLGRRLDEGHRGPDPTGILRLAGSLAGSGLLLVAIAAAGLVGAGPFGA